MNLKVKVIFSLPAENSILLSAGVVGVQDAVIRGVLRINQRTEKVLTDIAVMRLRNFGRTSHKVRYVGGVFKIVVIGGASLFTVNYVSLVVLRVVILGTDRVPNGWLVAAVRLTT